MPIAETQVGRISYQLAGAGPPLTLLLPQSTGPAGRQTIIDQLARQHRVLTYDQRGTGDSGPAPAEQTMASQAADVAALLDSIGIDRSALLCHSTGCGIGLSVTTKDPDRVVSLILTSPWSFADNHLTTMQNLRIAAAKSLDPMQYAHFNAALLFPPEFRHADQPGFSHMANEAVNHPQDAAAIARRLNAILAFDARPLLSTVQADTLVIVAKDDQLMPRWHAAEIAEGIARVKFIELDGGGHMLPETRTTEFVSTVLKFLQSAGLS